MLIVPTFQRSRNDLVQMGEKVWPAQIPCMKCRWELSCPTAARAQVETEKDQLLERFMEFAKHVCEEIAAQGGWAGVSAGSDAAVQRSCPPLRLTHG